ncbi:hypothetical protein HMPREF3180_01946 [Leptotrichia wadei]|uniref:Uncharacterized protein n=1 Tax=Leptotrichia wadei TaxID=157687 RepID=A0A133ZZN7_9FUSO|nr:hypothetical protein HMPREF3180_01946 [Leptotrichia wadei]
MRNSDNEKELGIDFSTNKVKVIIDGNMLISILNGDSYDL